MPPPLKRPAFDVWLAPPGTDPAAELPEDQLAHHHVVVHHADQLRAELEASKIGLQKGGTTAPMHLTSLWLWAALSRTGRYTGTFHDFKAACVAYEPDRARPEPHTDPDAEVDHLDAHPTEASTG